MKWSHVYYRIWHFCMLWWFVNYKSTTTTTSKHAMPCHAMPFKYKAITTTNKHGVVWSFLKDKYRKNYFLHLKKENKNVFECFLIMILKNIESTSIPDIFLDTGHRYQYPYISRKKVQYRYLEETMILYRTKILIYWTLILVFLILLHLLAW